MDVKTMLQPGTKGGTKDRRAWGLPVLGLWVPFANALAVTGEAHLSAEARGCPIVLRTAKDGSPKFTDTGRPAMKVVKEVSDFVNLIKENFAYDVMAHTAKVQADYPEQFTAVVAEAEKAGQIVADRQLGLLELYAENAEAQSPTGAAAEAERVLATA